MAEMAKGNRVIEDPLPNHCVILNKKLFVAKALAEKHNEKALVALRHLMAPEQTGKLSFPCDDYATILFENTALLRKGKQICWVIFEWFME